MSILLYPALLTVVTLLRYVSFELKELLTYLLTYFAPGRERCEVL